jgi:hypothetical protein
MTGSGWSAGTNRANSCKLRIQSETQRQLVSDLLDRAFGGSAAKLVLQALAAGSRRPKNWQRFELIDKRQGTR